MDNSFLELFKLLGGFNNNQSPNSFMSSNGNSNNSNFSDNSNKASMYYPNDFASSPQNEQNQNSFNSYQQDNNMLPLLMSLFGKGGNPLASILGKEKEENTSSNTSEDVKNDDELIIL